MWIYTSKPCIVFKFFRSIYRARAWVPILCIGVLPWVLITVLLGLMISDKVITKKNRYYCSSTFPMLTVADRIFFQSLVLHAVLLGEKKP
jgi:hypothetical protein